MADKVISPQIYSLIPKVMADIGAIGKDRKNESQGYKFRGIDDVYNASNSALAKHGVFSVPVVLEETRSERLNSKGTMLFYVYMKIKYTFFAPDGSFVDAIVSSEAFDSGDKATNKALSAGQKYAFLQVFCIPTEEPKDSEIDDHEIKPTPKVAEKAKSEPKVSPKVAENSDKKPVKAVENVNESYVSEINTALNLNHLKEVWVAVGVSHKKGELTDAQYAELTKLKDARKTELA